MKKALITLLLMAVMVNATRVNEITTDEVGEDLILNSSAIIQITAPVNYTNNQIEYSNPVTNTNQITNNVNGENLPYDISLQATGSHFRIQNDSNSVDLFFVRNNGGVALPQLPNLDCLGTAGDGTIQEGVCAAGGGTSEQDAYWKLNQDTLTNNDTIAHNLNVTQNITASDGLIHLGGAANEVGTFTEGRITISNAGGFQTYIGMGSISNEFNVVADQDISIYPGGLGRYQVNATLTPIGNGIHDIGIFVSQYRDAYLSGNVWIGGTINASQVFSRDSGLELASGTGEVVVTGDLNATNRVCDGAGNCLELIAANQTRISGDVTFNLDNVSDIHDNAAWSNTDVTFTSVDTALIQNSGDIDFQVNGDTNDYLKLNMTSGTEPTFTVIGDDVFKVQNNVHIGQSFKVDTAAGAVNWRLDNSDGGFFLGTMAEGQTAFIQSDGNVGFKVPDGSDYLEFHTVSNIPRIGCTGCTQIYFQDVDATTWETIHAAGFIDEVPDAIEKELKEKNKKALDYHITRDDETLNIDYAPESVLFDLNGSVAMDVGEASVLTILQISELKEELCTHKKYSWCNEYGGVKLEN